MANGLILLPTRRAARALAEAFLRVSDGAPLLLPRIAALGALDETPLALTGALDLPPAVAPAQRLAALTRLVLAMGGARGAPRTADRAWPLAAELAQLMDEAERAEIDLASRLPDAADPEHAAHWQQTLAFLEIVTRTWPEWLAGQGLTNPAARQVALLDAQARAWRVAPAPHPVLIAGATAAFPAIARLLKTVAAMEQGAVVLPALDHTMSEGAWDALEATHPQASLAALLRFLHVTRADVGIWPLTDRATDPAGEPRARPIGRRWPVLSTALLPARALSLWREAPPASLDGTFRMVAADQQEEAAAIALALRQAIEVPTVRAALITPDRALACRVSAELLRYGIVADDSAGEALSASPPAVFLRLLARAVAEELAPVPLLALLKHPFAAAALAPAACREAARALERLVLRGPRPPPGLSGLRQAVNRAKDPARERGKTFLYRLETCLEPALRIATLADRAPPAGALAALIEAAERLASTAETHGGTRLWAGEDGAALAERLSTILAVMEELPDQPLRRLPALLDAVLEGEVVRTRRALRGRDGMEHPRIFIWGLLEARLQSTEMVVLGGLTEGVWPPAADPGPWLSRQMRVRIGLPSPEERVGQAAHDFLSACCAAPTLILSSPTRRDGAPAVPARWITRLEAFIAGQGGSLPPHPAVTWARLLDQPADGARPTSPPRPRPAPSLRPRRLSVTEIETWLRDPFAIYASHILGLRPLDPIDESADAARYGELAHAALHRFLSAHGAAYPDDAARLLAEAMDQALTEAGLRAALIAWWRPRLARIAAWTAELDRERRRHTPIEALRTEVTGEYRLKRPGGIFALHGRADRIERRVDGRLAIIDYKTGAPPSPRQIDAGFAAQLPLEAAMAAVGGFGPELEGEAAELAYWHLTGGFEPGKVRPLFGCDPRATALGTAVARERLIALIDAYDDPARAYLALPHPADRPRFSHYAQLARVAEWSAAAEDG